MEVIDLIIKKANGEEVPKKIKYLESIWEWSSLYFDYSSDEQNSTINDELLFRGIFSYPKDRLNDEVEIIEEDEEIELIPIEEFNISYKLDFIDYKKIEILKEYLNKNFQKIFDTLDLLIINQKKIANELKKGK